MRTALPRGVILLYTILIMGVTSVLALAILAQASLGSYIGANEQASAEAVRAHVFGCGDEFLIQLQKDIAYAPATISIGSATCTLSVTTSGSNKVGLITDTENGITRGLKITFTPSPFAFISEEETLD